MEDVLKPLGVDVSFQFVFIFAMLVWARILALVSFVPFLWGKPVPMIARIAGATILMAFVVPLLLPSEVPVVTQDYLLLFFLFVKEVVIGLIIGFAASLVFYGFESAGHMIDNQRGMSIARVLIPQLGTQGSLSSQVLFTMAVAVYFALDGHVLFLQSFFESFVTLPVLEFPRVESGWLPLVHYLAKASGDILAMSLAISAPVIIAILVADIVLGVANRVAPQINVWELGFNIKGYLGVLMLAFMMFLMLEVMRDAFVDGQRDTQQTLRLLEKGETHALPMPANAPSTFPWLPGRNSN